MIVCIIIASVALSLFTVFFFVYKWYSVYARCKGITLNDIFVKGYYRPKYIDLEIPVMLTPHNGHIDPPGFG
ncbi:hypothetical protein SAMN06265379_101964 [Saccharicrinis carchari]|uniref:Uncharacterized protein n=1 Tax=Saccharicrinis carchari TaxID=1168039 RepID=A0A521BI87_SACCC|nr:hypothetical protein SAMN06265379_101964 [Saccharicrinis carchari]